MTSQEKYMKQIVEKRPLSSEYETDARYVWPERWELLLRFIRELESQEENP